MTSGFMELCPRCGELSESVFILTPETPHFGKKVCSECNGFLSWARKPKNEGKRGQNKHTPESLDTAHCELCLRPHPMLGTNECLEVHHKMPVHLGGDDVPSNILVLCTYCHKTVHQRQTYLYEHFRLKEV